jgi:hypothetical protein
MLSKVDPYAIACLITIAGILLALVMLAGTLSF